MHDLLDKVANSNECAGADVERLTGGTVTHGRDEERIDHVVDVDPVDLPHAARQPRRRVAKERGDDVRDQLALVALPGSVDHEDSQVDDGEAVETMEHPSVGARGELGGGVRRDRIRLGLLSRRLLERPGQDDALTAGRRGGKQQVDGADEVVVHGRKDGLDVARAGDVTGEVKDDVRADVGDGGGEALGVGHVRRDPADSGRGSLGPRDAVNLGALGEQPRRQMRSDEARRACHQNAPPLE